MEGCILKRGIMLHSSLDGKDVNLLFQEIIVFSDVYIQKQEFQLLTKGLLSFHHQCTF